MVHLPFEKIQNFFDLQPTLSRIAIQVSDKDASESIEIHDILSVKYPEKFFFIISDSSFNDCCVDVISAEHLGAEAIIHFGPFCSESYSVPVCFLPDIRKSENLEQSVYEKIKSFTSGCSAKNILVFLDQVEISRESILTACASSKSNILFAGAQNETPNSTRLFDFYIPLGFDEYKNTALVYIGPHDRFSMDLGAIFYHQECLRLNSISFAPFEGSVSRELARSSSISDSTVSQNSVGILVENPNNRLHVLTAQMLQKICLSNDLTADIVYVGRINEMKLGNFADINLFIHLACNGRKNFNFIKPIISPLEFICTRFGIDFWENQRLRDYRLFLEFCDSNQEVLNISLPAESNSGNQIVLKSFFELSSQLIADRKNYSYHGVEIDSSKREVKLHKGSFGNSTSYDNESK